jgi:rod shape-determining protein MreC
MVMSVGVSTRARVAATAFSLLCLSLLLTAYSGKNPSFGRLGVFIVSEAFAPVQSLVFHSHESVESVWEKYVWLTGVQQENKELRETLERIEGDVALLQEFKAENDRLRVILDFSRNSELSGVLGSVIGYGPSGWVKGIIVNRGSSHGVAAGMAVVHARGVVGQVVAVSPSVSRVLLISDHSSGVDAVVQGSRARGVVEGSGSGMSELRYINREFSIKVGELVLTSGMDGVFPKGLVIGGVTEVQVGGSGLFQTVEVKPAVDFARLEEVLILTSTEQPKIQTEEKEVGRRGRSTEREERR